MLAGILAGILDSQSAGFITRWTVAGDATARTITLPLIQNRAEGELSYNFTVSWGDGTSSTVTAYDDANRVHTYAANGTYDVEIRGTMEGWSFANAGDKLKITKVLYWGSKSAFAGFKYLASGFRGCTNLSYIASGPIPASGTGVLANGFYYMFGMCSSLVDVPAGLFRYHTSVSDSAFYYVFTGCTSLTSIPADLFRYNTSVSARAFTEAFSGCTSLTSIPADLFRYNTLAGLNAFQYTFYGCTSLASVPLDLFRYNTAVTGAGFYQTFFGCTKLCLRSSMFFPAGEESTRFVSAAAQNFTDCFKRTSFTGSQGIAPALWNCDYGETITLDVAPATDWAGGDTITGQSSGATAEVVAKVSALVYKIKKHFGTFTLGEVVGVTGVTDKLADQGAANPTFSGTPVSTGCFAGAGNSLSSLSNYADIPAAWK